VAEKTVISLLFASLICASWVSFYVTGGVAWGVGAFVTVVIAVVATNLSAARP
jgi:hypothetical protein